MIRHLLLVAATALLPLTYAQESGEDSQAGGIAEWVVELSNMPRASREAYTVAFQTAKKCFSAGRMAECESHLNTCELYTTKNPSVWNLRASALVAQKRFDAAAAELDKVREQNPLDSIARLNYTLIYMGKAEYEKGIEECDSLIEDIRYKNMEQLSHSLMFRKFLCLIMLERVDEARELVADVSPVDDSPLYYYSQGVLSLVAGNRRAAMRDLNTADNIYKKTGYLSGYKQALEFSGLNARYAAPSVTGAGR